MVAKFDDADLQAGVERLRRLFGAGAMEEARRQAARYRRETWGAQWWLALSSAIECAQPRLSRGSRRSIEIGEGRTWIGAGEYSERP